MLFYKNNVVRTHAKDMSKIKNRSGARLYRIKNKKQLLNFF